MKTIDQQVIEAVENGMKDAIEKKMGEYGSPLNKLVEQVVASNTPRLQGMIDDAFSAAISNPEIGPALRDAFYHKLARIIVSKFEGEIEKRANEMRADPTTRARITLAIEKAITP